MERAQNRLKTTAEIQRITNKTSVDGLRQPKRLIDGWQCNDNNDERPPRSWKRWWQFHLSRKRTSFLNLIRWGSGHEFRIVRSMNKLQSLRKTTRQAWYVVSGKTFKLSARRVTKDNSLIVIGIALVGSGLVVPTLFAFMEKNPQCLTDSCETERNVGLIISALASSAGILLLLTDLAKDSKSYTRNS